ncbi:MAG: hypothetical protein ACEPOW_06040 [Bacteroidales bacterium]
MKITAKELKHIEDLCCLEHSKEDFEQLLDDMNRFFSDFDSSFKDTDIPVEEDSFCRNYIKYSDLKNIIAEEIQVRGEDLIHLSRWRKGNYIQLPSFRKEKLKDNE